jgi:cobalamin biosynthesis Mg chelatase CobN
MDPVDPTVEELQRRLQELEARLAEVEIERAHERLRHREYSLGLIIENEAVRDKHRAVTKRVKRAKERQLAERRESRRREHELREQLAAVYASRTWKVGRTLISPLRGRAPGPRP